MSHGRLRIVVGASLVLVVAVGALVACVVMPSPYSAARNRAIGADASVTGGAVPNDIKAVAVAADVGLPVGLRPLGPITRITPAGALPAPATLSFKLDRQVAAGDVVLVETSESANGPWTLVASSVSSDRWSVITRTTHLSFWRWLWLDITSADDDFRHGVLDSLTGDLTSTADPPHCDNESQARAGGYTIASSAMATLYWCFGVENGTRVLKIVNRMRYPLDVSHPGFTVIHQANPTFDLDQLARLISGRFTVLFPFEEVDYSANLAPDTHALLATDFAGDAQSLYALQTGVSALVGIISALDLAPAEWAKAGKFATVMAFVGKLVQAQGCLNTLLSLNPGSLISACFDTAALVATFGVWAPIVLAVMVAAPIIEFFRSELNAMGDLLSGRSIYLILVRRIDQTVFATYVGDWGHHDLNLTINANGSGLEDWNMGPCFSDLSSDQMCTGNATITFATNPDGSITGTYQSIWFTSDGAPAPAGYSANPGIRVGDTFNLTHAGTGLLVVTATGESLLVSPTYLCGSQVPPADYYLCGA